jgi:hypothetical protein
MKTYPLSQPNYQPDQDAPVDMQSRLLGTIRGQFCTGMDDKKWYSLRDWFRAYVILWPAKFMRKKGFSIPAKRYEQIMRSIFDDIKRHGSTDAVKHWNGYLLKCVQDHFDHHWEEYYAEAKSIRRTAEAALMACRKVEREDPTVDILASAQAVLASKTRPTKRPKGSQMDLFKL